MRAPASSEAVLSVLASTGQLPSSFRDGDWMCPKCNFHNYRSKSVCPQCSTPMPPGGIPIPAAGSWSGDAGGIKKRKSKWEDTGAEEVPDWLKDLVPPDEPKPPPGVDPENWKLLKLEAVQIRALIGKGGETIRDVRARSGSDVQIDHLPHDVEGTVTITGDVEKTMALIKESLAAKGCPLGSSQLARPSMTGIRPQSPQSLMVAPLPAGVSLDSDISVPAEYVGGLIGPGGANIKAIREAAGNACYISVLPSASPGAMQSVRIVGENRDEAKRLVLQKIDSLKRELGARPPMPGFVGACLQQRPTVPAMGVGLVSGGHISGMTPNAGLVGLIRPVPGGAGGVFPRPSSPGALGGVGGLRPLGALGVALGSLGGPLGMARPPGGIAGFGGLPRLAVGPALGSAAGGLTTVPRGPPMAMNRGPVGPALSTMTGKSAPTQFGLHRGMTGQGGPRYG